MQSDYRISKFTTTEALGGSQNLPERLCLSFIGKQKVSLSDKYLADFIDQLDENTHETSSIFKLGGNVLDQIKRHNQRLGAILQTFQYINSGIESIY